MSCRETIFGEVPKDWTVKNIGDIAELSQGLQISKSKRKSLPEEGYIPLLKITDLPNKKFSEYVTDIKENYIALEDDIIYTRTGIVGLVYTGIKGCIHNNCFKVKVDYSKFDKNYIYYYLKSDRVYNYANSVAGGSVQKDLTHGAFKSWSIGYPSLSEQKKIGKTLKSLDEKIELNNQMNQTLEEMAQAIFKEWFVEFNFPNEDGVPYKDNGGEMVESELGEIPKGWRVGILGEISENSKKNIKKENITKKDLYIGLEHMPRKSIALDQWETAENVSSNKSCFSKGNILFGKLRPYFHKVGYAFIDGICSTEILVLKEKEEKYFGLLLTLVSSETFIEYASQACEGTRMPRANWKYLADYSIAIPNENISDEFTQLIKKFIYQIDKNIKENKILTQTRDILVPKLMSGEVRV